MTGSEGQLASALRAKIAFNYHIKRISHAACLPSFAVTGVPPRTLSNRCYPSAGECFSELMENNDLIIMEDATFDDVQDNYISTERTSIISHAPLGSSLRSLNTITGQQVYNISYYLKDETDNDDLILENGTGNIMTEESKPEGLRISDLETYFPQHTVNYYSDVPNFRSNLAFSSYIKSA